MTKLKLIIIEDCNSIDILDHLEAINWDHIQLEITWVVSKLQEIEKLENHLQIQKSQLNQIVYPEDDELQLLDILKNDKSDFICFFSPSKTYPSDYFSRILLKMDEDEDYLPNRTDKYSIRMLRAAQQSKYGLGIVKQDIKRNYEELNLSVLIETKNLQSSSFLELTLNEQTAQEVYHWAQKTNIEIHFYHPNYKSIEYYQNLSEYLLEVKKEAPKLAFQRKEDASGFPLYFLILIWLSLISAAFIPLGLLVFLILTAIYILAIGLECLAISTIKKQGELFMGLLVIFPFLHHIYLFYYFRGLFIRSDQIS